MRVRTSMLKPEYPKLLPNRKSTRLAGYDYSRIGWYYITTCTKLRAPWFGDVHEGYMELSDCGSIVEQRWRALASYPYVFLDEYVVMPDHFHGIIVIDGKTGDYRNWLVGTGRDLSLQAKVKPIPELIGAFKTTSSKMIHESGITDFQWQRSFHDHIIRNNDDLERIRHYIRTNPENWEINEMRKGLSG